MNYEDEKVFCSIDPVVFALHEGKLHVLIYTRKKPKDHPEDEDYPFENYPALPGGLCRPTKDMKLEEATSRVLKEKTGAEVNYVEQLLSRGGFRDPRGWTISISYIALITHQELIEGAQWVPVDEVLKNYILAFDHNLILQDAIDRLTNKVNYSTLPMHLFEDAFTLPQLQKVYEIILNDKMDKSTFRKKIEETGMLEETGEMLKDGPYRPAKFYRCAQKNLVYFSKNMKGPKF